MNFMRYKSKRNMIGFSLVEMLISVLIFTIVMGIVYTYLLKTKKHVISSEQELIAADNAQAALQKLRSDLYLVGIGRDSELNQPKLLKCSPYDIIFVADLDVNKANQTERYGAYTNGLTDSGDSADYIPIRTYVQSTGDWGWNPSITENYGSANNGAEIIRFSLDYNHDGKITSHDTEDFIAASQGMTHNQNPADFWLIKEWWGCTATSTNFVNSYSGPHPIAFNIRGNLYDPQASGLDRSTFIYPDTEWPDVLFTYWGHFLNNVTTHDDPGDADWDGEPLDLWGDWGGSPPPPTLPEGSSGLLNDGKLSQIEIEFLVQGLSSGTDWSVAHVINPENDIDDDFNGNGISGEIRLDQIVRGIGMTITTEPGVPDYDNPSIEHSVFSTDPPKIYPYRSYKVSIRINPQNLRYEGAPRIKVTPSTPTPVAPTFTPSPIPPTVPTGAASQTPSPSPTPPPDTTYTPTPTPDSSDYNDDEIIIGGANGFMAISLDNNNNTPSNLCINHEMKWYWHEYSAMIVEVESVNFCDSVFAPDEWNDLVYVTDDGVNDNLYYMEHLPHHGIDNAFQKRSSIRVGGGFNQEIIAMALGNIDYDAAELYPEIFVAYYDNNLNKSYINFSRLAGQCGSLIPPYCSPYVIDGRVQAMVMDDFNNDYLDELAVLIEDPSNTTPQLIVFDNLINCYSGSWNIMFMTDPFGNADIPIKIDSGKILEPNDYYPELIVVSSLGEIKIIPNTGPPLFFDGSICDPPLTNYPSVKGLQVYPSVMSEYIPFDQFAVISTDENMTLANYRSKGFCSDIEFFSGYYTGCSGPLKLGNIQTPPYDIDWFEINRMSGDMSVLATIIFNESTSLYELAIMGDVCQTPFPDDLCFINIGINSYRCLTSTHNAHTNEWNPFDGENSGKGDTPTLHQIKTKLNAKRQETAMQRNSISKRKISRAIKQ